MIWGPRVDFCQWHQGSECAFLIVFDFALHAANHASGDLHNGVAAKLAFPSILPPRFVWFFVAPELNLSRRPFEDRQHHFDAGMLGTSNALLTASQCAVPITLNKLHSGKPGLRP